jgi:hypothetical protein
MKQQEVSSAAAILALLVPMSMFMSPQWTRTFGVAHPIRCDESNAEAERGSWASPPSATTITRMNNRRIYLLYNTQAAVGLPKVTATKLHAD